MQEAWSPCSLESFAVRVDGLSLSHRLKEASGWQLVFSSPRLDWPIERLALGEQNKMVAVATGGEILLWALQAEGGGSEIGTAQSCSRTFHPSRA